MPIYSFSCSGCEREEEAYTPSFKDEFLCKECSLPMEKVWKVTKHLGGGVYPYVTKNFNGEPIEVTSSAHLEQLCKKFGVVHRPDSAWVEKTWERYNWKTGKHEYKEGSGMGLPGVWI